MEKTTTPREVDKKAIEAISKGISSIGSALWNMGGCVVNEAKANPLGTGLVVLLAMILKPK